MEEKYIVTSYKNPDLDGIACMYAYSEFIERCGKSANYYIEGTPKSEVKIVCDMFNIELKPVNSIEKTDSVVLVDTNSKKFISDKIDYDMVTEIIDHHSFSRDLPKFINANIDIKFYGAAATIVASRFKEYQLDISENAAILLYYGIISNTINLKSGVTTNEDREMAIWLESKFESISSSKIPKIFKEKTNSVVDLDLEMEANKGAKIFEGKTIMIGQLEIADSNKFISDKKDKIKNIIKLNSARENVDYAFCNVIDMLNGSSTFITVDDKTTKMLENQLNVNFDEDMSINDCVITRKEIVKKLRLY